MLKKVSGKKPLGWVVVLTVALFFSAAVVCAADEILQVTIEKSPQNPIAEIPVYLFSETGTYLGQNQTTGSDGKIEFILADGSYKLRVDYLRYQFWSPVYAVPTTLSETLTIAHQDVTITAAGDYQGTTSISGIPVYLFSAAGSYMNQVLTTDGNGQVVFSLPEQSYKVRADYLGGKFWSEAFTWQNTTVTVPLAEAEITVTGAGAPLEGVNVYAFTAAGSYLSVHGVTDAAGKVTFRLPAGDYKFRADYQGSQYWSAVQTLAAGQVNPVHISTGGGLFTFTVMKGSNEHLVGAKCYVFSEAGAYLGINAVTSSEGQVSFNLADGSYKLRVDYLGYQFWSPVYEVPVTLTETLTIAHQDVTITAAGDYQGTMPISGIPVYLFTAAGSYLYQVLTTDGSGQVVFSLPEQSYKVRADYLGGQFWSEAFTWQNTTVTVPLAEAEIIVSGAGGPLVRVNVYAFTAVGSYLSVTGATDAGGKVTFRLPAGDYKFRADYQGSQYWSAVTSIPAGVVTNVAIDTSPISVNLSADPETILAGESTTLTWSSKAADTCTIEPDIGTVAVNGSVQVSPAETTIYFITATGPGGVASNSITVTVNSPPSFPETKLTASDAADQAFFGVSTSICGDYAIVGASDTVNNGIQSGAAYIFKHEGTAWIEQAKLTASDAVEYDGFGYTVSIYGDYAMASGNEAVYVFKRDGAVWTEQAKLIASDAEGNCFGSSISIYGDYAIIGAPCDDSKELGSGAVYIFMREGSVWNEQVKLTAGDGARWDEFGNSVSIYGDYAVVGTGWANGDGIYQGAAYIFKRENASWTEQVRLTASDAEDYAFFGNSVSIYGDYVIAGGIYAGWDSENDIYQGAAYIFKRDGSIWDEQAKIVAGDPSDDNLFGSSVSIYKDYAVVGAEGNYEYGNYIGAAYIFKREGSAWTQQTKITAGDAGQWPICEDLWGECTGFGSIGSVSLYGSNTIIGAYGASTDGMMTGAAYVYSIPTVTAEISSDPANILVGGSTTLSWTSTGAGACVIEPGIGTVAVNGSLTISPTQTTTYTITATGPAGTTTNSVIVNVIDPTVTPAVNINATPAVIQWGSAAILSWSSTNAGSAIIDQGIGSVDVNGSIEVIPEVATTYTITVSGPAGTRAKSVTVGVSYPTPVVSLIADRNLINSDMPITLSWASTNASTCVIEPGIGAVPLNGSLTVLPPGNITYTITASNPGASTTDSVALTLPGSPTVEFSAIPTMILQGESSTLTWNSMNATSCWINPDSVMVDLNGSLAVSPNETTTYYINATGPGGSSTFNTTVIVIPPPTVDISANPAGILTGESSTLTWNSTYADSCIIDPNIGTVAVNGSIIVNPTENITYTIIATGPAGTTTDNVTVNVYDPSVHPTVEISATPNNIEQGRSATLSWSSSNAEFCVIEGIGNVDVNGSIIVSPSQTTKYTITASSPAGVATDSEDIVVLATPEDVDFGFDFDEQQGGGGLIGETIRILNGNSLDMRSDLNLSSPNQLGFSFFSVFNGRSSVKGSLGFGWTHSYEASLDPAFEIFGIIFLRVVDATGRAFYFSETTQGVYKAAFNERSYVKAEGSGYVWYRLDGSTYGFSSTGRLDWIKDAIGNELVLSFNVQGRLETVTDTAGGRSLSFNYNGAGLLDHISGPVTAAVPDGIWATYGYDANQNLTSVTYTDDSGFNYFYTDPADVHNLTEKKNKMDHLINSWGYDTQDRAVSNFSVKGKGVNIDYVSSNQVNVTDAYGKMREYYPVEVPGGRKRVELIADGPGGAGEAPYSDSNAVAWIYDEEMRPTSVEYAGGAITRYLNYDDRGNAGTIELAFNTPDQRTITYTYHPSLNVPLTRAESSVLGSGDKVTVWDYDNDYNAVPNENPTALLSRIVEQGFTRNSSGVIVSFEYVTTFTYNGKGQVLSIDGPKPGDGDKTSFSYDTATGDLLSTTRPHVGITGLSQYDAAGKVGRVTDVNGQSRTFTYDGRGRVTTVTNQADGSSSATLYNTAGLPSFRTDEDGVVSSFEYDPVYGRLSKFIDQDGNNITYSYDDQGNMIEMAYYDPLNTLTNRKRYLYQDPAHNMPGLLYKEINADDTFTVYGYDAEGNVTSVTDPNGNTTTYSYDPLNRLKTAMQPGSVVTTYAYDCHGNLTIVTDAISNSTTHEYDDMARVLSTTSPDTGTVTSVYDEAGNPDYKTDANGITIDYSYDFLNRLTDVNFSSHGNLSAYSITYTYDDPIKIGVGSLTGISDPSGSMIFGYDNRGRLVEKTSNISGQSYSLFRSYTPGGRISNYIYPTGRTVDYDRRTCACRVDAVTTTYNGNTVTLMNNISYRPFGTADGMNTGAGGTVASQFDASGRLIVANPGSPKEKSYTYDANGNLTSVTSGTFGYSGVYGYDALNRLDHAEGSYGTINFTNDDVGNRLTKWAGGATATYAYAAGTNQLQEITGPVTYTHDAAGNITGIGARILTYNQNNRLVKVEEGESTLGEYTYNGMGQRVIKVANGTAATVFHYDFDGNIIGESDLNGNFSKEYLYKGKSRLAMVDVDSSAIYYYGNDHLGTPQILTDPANAVVWEGFYKPFGEAWINPGSSVVNNFRFAGQYYDQETGLHYNYHRYYDPKIGRYLTPDPIGLEGGVNLFAYVQNNPMNAIDPDGLNLLRSAWNIYLQYAPVIYEYSYFIIEDVKTGAYGVVSATGDTSKWLYYKTKDIQLDPDAVMWLIMNSTEPAADFIAETYRQEREREWKKFYYQYQRLNPPRPKPELYWVSAEPVPLSEIMPNLSPQPDYKEDSFFNIPTIPEEYTPLPDFETELEPANSEICPAPDVSELTGTISYYHDCFDASNAYNLEMESYIHEMGYDIDPCPYIWCEIYNPVRGGGGSWQMVPSSIGWRVWSKWEWHDTSMSAPVYHHYICAPQPPEGCIVEAIPY